MFQHVLRTAARTASQTSTRHAGKATVYQSQIAGTSRHVHQQTPSIRRFSSTPFRGAWHKDGDAATFERVTSKENTSDKVVLVDFYADWCGPCKFLSPILEEVTADSPQPTRTGSGRTIDLLTVNIDEQGELAAQFKVRSIPLVVAFKDGVEVDRFIGAKNKEGVLEFVGKL